MAAFHHTLRQRRLDIGMGEGRASQLLGLTVMGYYDLEAYADEWRTVVPLYITIFACRLFEIDMLEFVPDQPGVVVQPNAQAGDLIRQRREEIGLSAGAFEDRCGYLPGFTPIVEACGLVLYPFEDTRVICEALGLDLKSFVQHALLASR